MDQNQFRIFGITLIAKIIPIITLIAVSSCIASDSHTQAIDNNWKFKQASSTEWLPATVPGNVHTDLLDNGIIENPYYRLNEKKQQWIENETWEYQTTFHLKKSVLNFDQVELNFEGLDTSCDIYLNDSLLLKVDNMFRQWKIPCKSLLLQGNNTLHLVFHSAVKCGTEAKSKLEYPLLSNMEQAPSDSLTSMFCRKAPFHFGWDWSPRLVTAGIWRPIKLVAWNNSKLDDVYIHQNSVTDSLALLAAKVKIRTDNPGTYSLSIRDQNFQEPLATKALELTAGVNYSDINFEIKNPKLWWTHNLGTPYLYQFDIQLEKDGKLIDHFEVKTGIRNVRIVQNADSLGRSFFVELNNVPVFMKGANYIPQDNFNNRVTPARYQEIILSAKQANMDMLRVWGGGIYENDQFYDLCDEHGILVWQDFMFACAQYPGNPEFLDNVKEEAKDNITRLRNHPSIALWCGNNEISMFHKWKWPNPDTRILAAYDSIFFNILPSQVSELTPNTFYWPSSPSSDFKDTLNTKWSSGNMHYWGVWHNKQDFSAYKNLKNSGRFMTEFGFQSFPCISTINEYTIPSDQHIYSDVMKSHQRNPSGNELINYYMDRYYQIPSDFEQFIYLSQVLQAEAVKTGVEFHRRSKPFTMGSLYWQLNDCWPVASWSSIDYFGRWKALHYYAHKFNADLLVSPTIEDEKLNVYVVSDLIGDVNAKLQLQLLSLTGDTIMNSHKEISVFANASHIYQSFEKESLIKNHKKEDLLVVVQLIVDDLIVSENSLSFVIPKDRILPKPALNYTIEKEGAGFIVHLKTDVLAKNVFIQSKNAEGHFSDNYFDINPNSIKEIRFKCKQDVSYSDFEQGLEIMSLYDTQTN